MVYSYSAGQVPLPQSSISQTTSLLFDSLSSSLALLHSDSSISLYPSFSPLSSSLSSLSFPQTFISGPTSSAAFLPLFNPTRRLLFLVISPSSSSSLLLRFWILSNKCFVRARVECTHSLLNYENAKSGVVFSVNHGASVKLVTMSNVFVVYCVSSKMVYVFAVRMVGGDGEESESVKLIKTGVIECCLPVFSIGVSSRFLVLGEFDGVRVFSMQVLVKGRVKKSSAGRLFNLNDGKVNGGDGSLDGKFSAPTKLRSARLRQDSKGGSCFVSLKEDSDSFNSIELQMKPVKAINIEALSPNEFLIMDSARRIHHLCLSNSVLGSEVSCHMNQLSLSIEVQKMAVLPGAQTFWISDGQHTVHTISLSDQDTSINGGDRKDDDKKLMQISVTSAIFSSETIQQLVPSAANAILILGQGSIFAYTI